MAWIKALGASAEASGAASQLPEPTGLLDPRIRAAQAGDPAAMEALVVELLPRVRNLVRYLVRGDSDVDDVAQDALVKVLERLHSFRGEGRLESWVDGVVLRVTLVSMRRRSAEARRHGGESVEGLVSLAPVGLPDRYMARRQTVAALDEVPDKQRHTLVMHHVLGMSVPEIADAIQVPVETVRSRLRLGMKRLRTLLVEPGGEDAMRPVATGEEMEP
jgi:RNA polymerase sigma-70 factor (ECF subfamily)